MNLIIFLDIDGVVCFKGRGNSDALDSTCVEWLNRIISMCHTLGMTPQIVINSAWNSHPLADLKESLVKAGFKYPNLVCDQTAGVSGGGDLIREWLDQKVPAGTPYLILDDSSHQMDELWCRLVKCNSASGLTQDVYERACQILYRFPVNHHFEVLSALHEMTTHLLWLSRAHWLTPEQKTAYVQQSLDLAKGFLSDPDFLKKARLA